MCRPPVSYSETSPRSQIQSQAQAGGRVLVALGRLRDAGRTFGFRSLRWDHARASRQVALCRFTVLVGVASTPYWPIPASIVATHL